MRYAYLKRFEEIIDFALIFEGKFCEVEGENEIREFNSAPNKARSALRICFMFTLFTFFIVLMCAVLEASAFALLPTRLPQKLERGVDSSCTQVTMTAAAHNQELKLILLKRVQVLLLVVVNTVKLVSISTFCGANTTYLAQAQQLRRGKESLLLDEMRIGEILKAWRDGKIGKWTASTATLKRVGQKLGVVVDSQNRGSNRKEGQDRYKP